MLCVDNKKDKTELKAMCDWHLKKKKKIGKKGRALFQLFKKDWASPKRGRDQRPAKTAKAQNTVLTLILWFSCVVLWREERLVILCREIHVVIRQRFLPCRRRETLIFRAPKQRERVPPHLAFYDTDDGHHKYRIKWRYIRGDSTSLHKYSGTSPYGNLTSKVTSPLRSPFLSPKLYSTMQWTPAIRSPLH